ncbi:DUF421 domain-containing protein [Georgenia halophila]|uniref:DUF421 domain-containing protein n=1 Tax=Georgenia halophila TaxID=620889 RepID=A0ABP8L1D1_9MICO
MNLWEHIGVGPVEAVAVVLSTFALYTAFLTITRLLGQRVLATLSTFDVAVVIVLGAILGRAALGHTPTLAGGLLALLTLVALEGAVGALRRHAWFDRLVSTTPVLLMAGPTVLIDHLDRAHITEAELRSRLRLSGVRSTAEVAAVVLEPTGAISVLCRGEPMDPALLAGVRGAELLPASVLEPGCGPLSDPEAASPSPTAETYAQG